MKKIAILLLPFLLTACDGLSSKKVKNIVEMTPKLSIESNEPIQLDSNLIKNSTYQDTLKYKAYNISKHKIISKPVFAKGIVYSVDSRGIINAFSKKEKKILWSYNTTSKSSDANCIGGGITYNNGKLYITNGSRFLIILSDKGHEIVRKEFPDIIRTKPVMLSDNLILIQTVSNQFFAYDIDHSNFVWQHEGMTETLSYSTHISPVVYKNRVLANYTSGQIFSLNAKTGQEEWSLNLSSEQDVSLPNFEPSLVLCDPIVDDSNIYIASSTSKLIKFDLLTGAIKWQIRASDIQSMSLYGNNIFITNNAMQVASINSIDGKVVWVADLELQKEGKKSKVKATSFLPPFIAKVNNGWALNVIANNGGMYSFHADSSGYLTTLPIVTKIVKNIQYKGVTCCGDSFLVTEKQIAFSE